MITINKYKAFDGKTFDSEAECLAYEEANAASKEMESDISAYADALEKAGYSDRAVGIITGHVRKYLTWVDTGELAAKASVSAAEG